MHGDGAAGDKIFANSIAILPQDQSLSVDITITQNDSKMVIWPAMAANIITTNLQHTASEIVSDNINDDGVANPGESVRFIITLTNPYQFAFRALTVQATTPLTSKSVYIPAVPPNSSFTPAYNALDTNSFLEISIPSNYSASSIVVNLALSDTSGNKYTDSVIFPVVAFVHENAVLQRLKGHSSMFPSVIVTQKSVTQNDSYVVVGIDSVDINSTPGYSLRVSSTGSVITQHVPLTETEFMGYGSTPVDGFKVNWGGAYTRALTSMTPVYSSSDTGSFPWFSPRSPNDPSFLYLGLQFNNGMNGATGDIRLAGRH